ncbi:MAG TPA: hypothetical protein VMH37_09610 [Candidatus Binataceae bacterium]|nr:hypothetical protein [Candidatus Binataceae bacterium]
MGRTHEKERIAALAAGLAIVILAWSGLQAFVGSWIDSLGDLSPWLYGPFSAAIWGLLSLGCYALIIRAQRRNPALCYEHEEATREARLRATGELRKTPPLREANALEQDKLAAVTGGFAITIAAWLAILSFGFDWLAGLRGVSPWAYCLVSLAIWFTAGHAMYWSIRRSRRRASLPHV